MEILRALWPGRGASGGRRRAERPDRSRRAARLEGLEGRALLSTFTGEHGPGFSMDPWSKAVSADVISFAPKPSMSWGGRVADNIGKWGSGENAPFSSVSSMERATMPI
jgi:hypothetical protein